MEVEAFAHTGVLGDPVRPLVGGKHQTGEDLVETLANSHEGGSGARVTQAGAKLSAGKFSFDQPPVQIL